MIDKKEVEQLLKKNSVQATKFIKGPREFRLDSIPFIERKEYDKRTVLYECVYNGRESVIKILIEPDRNKTRFLREIYFYQHIATSSKLWQEVSPQLLLQQRSPVPFIVMEKLQGEVLGDWFHIKLENPTHIVKLSLDLALKLHKKTILPKHIALGSLSSIDFFTRQTKIMKKVLMAMNTIDRQKTIFSFNSLKEKLRLSWNLDTGFVFNDFNPANIFITKDGSIKFLDFDQVSNGRFEYDLSFIYLAALGGRDERKIIKTIDSYVIDENHKMFLDYFLIHRLLGTLYNFKAGNDNVKYNASMAKLKSLIDIYST